MGKQSKMEKDLTEHLQAMGGAYYTSPSVAFPGQIDPMTFKSDGMLFKEGHALVLEVEVGQTHPDTNVGKYWPMLEMGTIELKRFILVHVIAQKRSALSRLQLGHFYAEKMKQVFGDKFLYIRVPGADKPLGENEILTEAKEVLTACFKDLFKVDQGSPLTQK